MATFNVFVEGPVDDSPMGLPELAETMSQRYGLPATELVARMKRGRFRVKSNLDAATAERYRQDLESIGARVIVEDSSISPTATPVAGTPVVRPSALSLPPINAPRTGTIMGGQLDRPPAAPALPAPPARPSAPPARPATGLAAAGPLPPTRPSAPPSRPSTPPSEMVSGLSAAYGAAPAQADLGALGDMGALSLASLDGEEAPAASNQFDAPPEPPAAVVTIAAKPKTTAPPRTKPADSKAMDLFAPPDAGDQELKVDLATDEIEERARKKASVPPANVPQTPPTSPPLARRAAVEPAHGTSTPATPTPFSRAQFLLGIVIALVVGFIPTHFIASAREKSAFGAIDQRVEAAYASADSSETYQALDAAREKFIDAKQSARTMIGLTSMLMWAMISTGVGFAFFRFRKS